VTPITLVLNAVSKYAEILLSSNTYNTEDLSV
jgi:hypothetical protein